jgi:hypothetical protein
LVLNKKKVEMVNREMKGFEQVGYKSPTYSYNVVKATRES